MSTLPADRAARGECRTFRFAVMTAGKPKGRARRLRGRKRDVVSGFSRTVIRSA